MPIHRLLFCILCAVPAVATAQVSGNVARPPVGQVQVQPRPSVRLPSTRVPQLTTRSTAVPGLPAQRGSCGPCPGPSVVYYVMASERVSPPDGVDRQVQRERRTAEPRPDGSREHPFASTQAAFRAASRARACRLGLVLISVRPATRRRHVSRWRVRPLVGNLTVTRHTTIRTDEPFSRRPILRGQISNLRGCELAIRDVLIEGAVGNAVQQAGGRLTMRHVELTATRPGTYGNRDNDAVIYVGSRAVAVLDHVTLRANAVRGLYVSGRRTRAHLSHVELISNRPEVTGLPRGEAGSAFEVAALQVSDRATVWSQSLRAYGNAYIAIDVFRGGRAHLRDTLVRGTTRLDLASGDRVGGINIALHAAGVLELHEFRSIGASFVGLCIWDQARLNASHGVVRDNRMGVVIGDAPDVDPSECFEDVESYDNEVDFDSTGVAPTAAPTVGELTGRAPAAARPNTCAVVPWRAAP